MSNPPSQQFSPIPLCSLSDSRADSGGKCGNSWIFQYAKIDCAIFYQGRVLLHISVVS